MLVIALGVLGLSAWAGWLDYVPIPALVILVGITIYAWHRRRAEAACCDIEIQQNQKKGA